VNAYYVVGALLAVWALGLTAVGVKLADFPRTNRQAIAVGAVSVLLAASTIGSGIVTGILDEGDDGHAGATASPPGPGATEQPDGRSAKERAGSTVRLSADPSGALAFDKKSLDAKAGDVTLVASNPSPVPHNISVEGHGIDEHGKTVGQGGSSTVQAKLAPGEYAFYCSVPGHRQGGMEGALTVR
jgi:uncharacterized cupredoxin-like copper-binding protein